jgi:SAM-dependent methyltransferase
MTVPIVFDRKIYAARRHRAARSAGDQFLVNQVAENMAERLDAVKKRFSCGLDLGSRSSSFAPLAPYAGFWVRTSLSPADEAVSLAADEEALPFAAQSFDLVVSVLSLHAVNDLPGTLVQIRRVLKPDGLFLAALFGGATLGELRRAFAAGEVERRGGASPHIAPFADVRDMGQLLQRAGFAQPVADLDRTLVRYTSFATLVNDLRALGETNSLASRERAPLRRDVLQAALAHYALHDADDQGKLTATFDIVSLTGWSAVAGPDQ